MSFFASALPPETRRVALIVAGAFFMQTLDSSILVTSLPQMAATFGVQPVEMSAAITVYLLVNAALTPISAWLADRFGARRVLAWALAVFTLASVACACVPALWAFILARACQGGAGAMMMPVGRMIVVRQTDRQHLMEATALVTWPGLIGPVLGPVVGGAITTWMGWHWNFWINLPLGLVGVWLVTRHVPETTAAHVKRFDLVGAGLTGSALVCVLYGLEVLSQQQAPWMWPVGLIAVGAALAWRAWQHLSTCAEPLLDLSVFRVPSFAVCALAPGMSSRVAISSTPFLLPLLFQLGWGWSAAAAGGLVMVYFAGNLGMKGLTSPLLRRFGFRRALMANGWLLGACVMACGWLGPSAPLVLVVPLLLMAGLTRSLQFTGLNTLGYAELTPKQSGTAATILSMLQPMGSMLGTALAAALLNLMMAWHGRSVPVMEDFHWAFGFTGVIGLLGGCLYGRLHPSAGHEVSGRRGQGA